MTTDPETGLPNRAAWCQALEEALAAKRTKGVVLLDIDRLRLLNVVDGHRRADELLVAVAAALKMEGVFAGRIGGDEFGAIILAGAPIDVARRLWQCTSDVTAAFDTPSFRQRTDDHFRTCGGHDVEQPVLGVTLAALDLSRVEFTSKQAIECLFEALADSKRVGIGRLVVQAV